MSAAEQVSELGPLDGSAAGIAETAGQPADCPVRATSDLPTRTALALMHFSEAKFSPGTAARYQVG